MSKILRMTPRRPTTLIAVERAFEKWLHDDDHVPLHAILATYAANHTGGDPTWLMIVGGSGDAKTTRLMTLEGLEDVVMISSLTGPAALLSASPDIERTKSSTGGLLRRLPPGGLLILKDFTTILDMHKEKRSELLAALREIHDGKWSRETAVDGGRTFEWKGKVGMIAACTSAIDMAHSVVASMGPRFLYIRTLSDANTVAHSAALSVGHEEEMRKELREVVHRFLKHMPGNEHGGSYATGRIEAISKLVAAARSPVERDYQGQFLYKHVAESPARIVKQLLQIWRASGLIGLSKDEAWQMVWTMGRDSIPTLRCSCMEFLDTCKDAQDTETIATSPLVHSPSRSVLRALEDLTAHGVVDCVKKGGTKNYWKLSVESHAWLKQTGLLLKRT